MDKNILNGNWNVLKGQIQQTWGKLSNDDLMKVKGNFNELTGRLQKVYGYTKEEANAEIETFKQQHADAETFKREEQSPRNRPNAR